MNNTWSIGVETEEELKAVRYLHAMIQTVGMFKIMIA